MELSMVSTIAALLSSLTALVAVIVAPLVQSRVAKRQIWAATVSANRQAWINLLRDTLATLHAYSSDVREFRVSGTSDPLLAKEVQEKARQATLLLAKLTLFLNPNEQEQQQLLGAVIRLWNISDSTTPNNPKGDDWQRAAQEMTALGQQILKSEWERVKRGD